MAATISIELRERLLRSYFSRDIPPPDDILYVALTGAIGLANATGDSLDEPSAAAYARASVLLDADNWALTGFGEIQNTQDIVFPDPNTGEDWGYIGGWALVDAADSGVTLAVGSLILPTTFTSDMPSLAIQPGGITIGLYDQ
jgi:hypothetical protein